jgi:diguanylate cyclase (GGDEF)-like protein/PAS domain S-box-containing protein
MNERTALDSSSVPGVESPPSGYAGRPRDAQLEYKAILANASIGIAFTRERKFTLCNPRFAEMLGWKPEELIGQPGDVVYPSRESYEALGQIAIPALAAGKQLDVEWELRRKDGSGFWCRMSGRALEAGSPAKGYAWLFEDVTARKRADSEIQRVLHEQELTPDNATVGIAFLRERVFQRCNPRLEEMFGYEPGTLAGTATAELFLTPEEHEAAGSAMFARLAAGQSYIDERMLRRKDTSRFWCKVVVKALDAAHPEEGAIAIFDDISAERAARRELEASRDALEVAVAQRTEELQAANQRLQAEIADRRQAETRAQHLADHDALTGLPNRRLLEDRLTQALAASQRNRRQTAVMFVDLDLFKAINDSLGHATGDIVLREVAERLKQQLRVVDTTCRMGGDEFVVVLPEIKRSSDAAHVAAKILETVAQPIRVEDRELNLTPSIGISVFPDDGRDAETLIRNADAAMYHAKETGRANYQFFTEQMNQAASRRIALESELRRAVQAGEMRVWYQPMVELAGWRTAAYEALLRWQHPQRGVLAPAEFLQIAEDTGMIVRLGEWLIGEACRWVGFIGAERGLPVSVNLSQRQFSDPKLVDMVARALKEAGLPPALLELEIAEPTVMQNVDHALATLAKLRALGVTLAIDGFGAAYSSLIGLRQLPVQKLKLDRSLAAEVHREGRAIVSGIVGLAHALGLKVTAVGVEKEAQKQALAECGCDYAQGLLTGAPADADADAAAREYL